MNRCELITLFQGAAKRPLTARAQEPAIAVIGYLGAESLAACASRDTSFPPRSRRNRMCRGSKCRNRISLGGRSTQQKRFCRQVAVIVAAGGAPAALPVKSPQGSVSKRLRMERLLCDSV